MTSPASPKVFIPTLHHAKSLTPMRHQCFTFRTPQRKEKHLKTYTYTVLATLELVVVEKLSFFDSAILNFFFDFFFALSLFKSVTN